MEEHFAHMESRSQDVLDAKVAAFVCTIGEGIHAYHARVAESASTI